jgi:hypothetical protein
MIRIARQTTWGICVLTRTLHGTANVKSYVYIILKIYYIDCYYVICTRTTCYNAICYIDTQIVVASVGCLLRHSDIS